MQCNNGQVTSVNLQVFSLVITSTDWPVTWERNLVAMKKRLYRQLAADVLGPGSDDPLVPLRKVHFSRLANIAGKLHPFNVPLHVTTRIDTPRIARQPLLGRDNGRSARWLEVTFIGTVIGFGIKRVQTAHG
ncbi:hypothetical protein D3C77_525510 [compost metagenome]